MRHRRLALAVLACSLLAATAVQVVGGSDKRVLTHDESISLLAAACHQGDYARLTTAAEPPFGRWVPASEWKDLLRPDRTLCLAEIGRDLAHEDIHPPLYFWLLHGWSLAVGVGLWTGLSLNLVLAILAGLSLFGLARRVLGDPLRAALVTAVWAFSPAAIRVFAEARQYELVALLSTLLISQCVRFCDPPTRTPRRDALLLALIVAAGALTHFLFALVVVAGAALLAARLGRTHRGTLAWGLGSIAAGYVAFALLHPGFLLSLRRGGEQRTPFSLELLPGRARETAETFAGFVLPPELASGVLGYLVLAALVAATGFLAVRLRRRPAASPGARAMPLVFAWLALAHAGLFLAFVSPASGMGFKHLSAVWPFAAFVPVLALGELPRRARAPAGALGGAVLVAVGTVAMLGQFTTPALEPPLLGARVVVLDNVARGVLPRIVWRLPDGARVFAADQRYLLEHRAAWLPELEPGALYVGGLPPSDPRYGNSIARGRRVAAAIARRHRLVPVPDPLDIDHSYRVVPEASDSRRGRESGTG